ncbi:hypothetical protein K6U06_19805 [Acidiferrimicrobium sp. IK]|uniref:DNA primase family protein n=1 Tax=Acidiferrimicrobium sp. IK TaxID=2871700 RepID=UPI0021CB206D|nr:phage/plasmid primase, P4 family [Acidiferrimicrobium sp. IK]MCU4186620.1 hypothetical protein [Acidiferrimicrobium sp. IK]
MSVARHLTPVRAGDPACTFEMSELGNARRLVAEHGHDLRYVPEWGAWLAWDGRRWARDHTGERDRRAKAVADAILDDAHRLGDDKRFRWGVQSQSARGIGAMLTLAATEPGIPVRVAELDADPWLLNVGNGTISLRSGLLQPHDRQDLITKMAGDGVDYHPDAISPRFAAFLEQVLPDPEVRKFLARFVGYTLTGTVGEQVLVFLLGSGANGKSTLTSLLLRLLGEYAAPAPPRLLVVSKHPEHPTSVADLLGRRLVIAQEVQAGAQFDEEMVKVLTGGDVLKARFMRGDFFEFAPSHKVVMGANHRPTVRGTDLAIWRRLRLVPFDVTVPEEDRDPHLLERLAEELPGVLSWAVQGCLAWQSSGLTTPSAVTAATEEYRIDSDVVGQFIAECCVETPGATVQSAALYASYRAWAETCGLHPMSQKALTTRLRERGLDSTTDRQRRTWWCGIGLVEDQR